MALTVLAVLFFFQALATAHHNLRVTHGLPLHVEAICLIFIGLSLGCFGCYRFPWSLDCSRTVYVQLRTRPDGLGASFHHMLV